MGFGLSFGFVAAFAGVRVGVRVGALVAALAGAPILPALALDSDKAQPATLEADDFELDLETGVRTYRNNVVFRQGSIRLDCDRLVTHHNADDQLETGVCSGAPGRFKQRPEGRDSDLLGHARSITLDRIEDMLILEHQAGLEQGGNAIRGQRITYDLRTKKVKVTGGETTTPAETGSTDAAGTGSTTPAGADGEERTTAGDETGAGTDRPRLIIQPRNAPQD